MCFLYFDFYVSSRQYEKSIISFIAGKAVKLIYFCNVLRTPNIMWYAKQNDLEKLKGWALGKSLGKRGSVYGKWELMAERLVCGKPIAEHHLPRGITQFHLPPDTDKHTLL